MTCILHEMPKICSANSDLIQAEIYYSFEVFLVRGENIMKETVSRDFLLQVFPTPEDVVFLLVEK
jgi:hypothetical protein